MTTLRQEKAIQALKDPKVKTYKEAGLIAGYAEKSAKVSMSRLKKKIEKYGETGLDVLDNIARTGINEIARVQAGKTLIETAYGKPKNNDKDNNSNAPVNIIFNRVEQPKTDYIEGAVSNQGNSV